MEKSFANQTINNYQKKDRCNMCNNHITSSNKSGAYCSTLKCWRKKETDRGGYIYTHCEKHNNDAETGWRLTTPGGNPLCKNCDDICSRGCSGYCNVCGKH